MNRIGLVLLALFLSCAPSPDVRAVGWQAMPAEPSNQSWGTINWEWKSVTRLEGKVSLLGPAPGKRLYLAVRWANSTEPVVLTPLFGSEFGVEVDPPASARTRGSCGQDRAEGLVLVYLAASDVPDPARDELVSVSQKQRGVFSSLQTIYSQPFAWDLCVAPRPLVPLLLQHDPRLALAGCAPDCDRPLFERTHVVSASLSFTPEGSNLRFEVLGAWPSLAIEVNGESFARDELDRASWVDGLNTVRITAGDLPPWTAEVVVPSRELQVQLGEASLRVGEPFTLGWTAPWASETWVYAVPLDVPLVKTADPSFEAAGQSITEVFPGFRDATGEPREVPRAKLLVRASLDEGPFGLSVEESIAAPIE
jgi:hypothetical protein